jgi:hypothetical protein
MKKGTVLLVGIIGAGIVAAGAIEGNGAEANTTSTAPKNYSYTYTLSEQEQAAIQGETYPEPNANHNGHAMIAYLPFSTDDDLKLMKSSVSQAESAVTWKDKTPYVHDMANFVSRLQDDMAESQYVGRIDYVNHDLADMKALAEYANAHQDEQAIKLYAEGCQDLNYYLMNGGEPAWVLTVEDGNAVDNFLKSHNVEVGN